MYAAKNDEEHTRFFSEFVDDIKKYSSQESSRIPPQMIGARVFDQDIKSQDPREIALLDCEQVRQTLSNILLEKISQDNGKDTYDKFDEFVQKYRYPIQTKSFYKDTIPPDNVFFGYEVIFPALGAGNFGEAYQAKRHDGKIVCLKIMHSNIVSNREMIGGFRRGIRSMEILRKHSIDGVVKIIESFEMPPTIVMDIAPGNSLQEIFHNIKDFPWQKKLELICVIGSIVDECHKLPEMVLHRDIKPSNVMLEGLDYSDYSFSKLYVLDFDMSWHKNSSEKDIIFESRDDFGYLAPEQTDPSRRTTTRSAKVDSYGLAMTAFAVFGGAHPVPGWTMSPDWPSKVHQITRSGYNADWKCLPRRLSRALIEATAVAQDVRLDFSSFWRRLLKIKTAASSTGVNQPVDLIAEEILAQIATGREYAWDDVVDKGSFQFVNGARIEVSVDDNQSSITIYVGFSDQGSSQFKSRNQLIGEARDLMDHAARQLGAKIKRVNVNHGMLDFHVSVNFNGSLSFAHTVATLITPAIDKLVKIQ